MDSFTVDIDFYKNAEYFNNIIKKAQNNNFLMKEYTLSEKSERLKNSAFNTTDEDSHKANFLTFIPDKEYERKETSFTLAQCLICLIEKAINVHYFEYAKGFTK